MTVKKIRSKKSPHIETLDAESIALIASQVSDLLKHRDNRIIAAVEKMLKPITDTFKSNGGTLEQILGLIGGLEDKIAGFEKRQTETEHRMEKRIERIERAVGLADVPVPE
jgi:hypothetical protein